MGDALAGLIFFAVVGLLILLRFDAPRFGAAEYDDEEAPGGWRTWLRRLSWYCLGVLLLVVVYLVYPQPLTVLHLQVGEPRSTAILAGLAIGGAGMLFAVGYAWWRFGDLRLPPLRRYPAGVVISLLTAFLDEAVFRGVVLGLLLFSNWPVELAIAFQAVFYALATRLAGGGRPRGMLLMALAIGAVGGWLTVETGGIGGAFLGHSLANFAVFLATGHAGAMRAGTSPDDEPGGGEPEVVPQGWEIVGDGEPHGGTGLPR
jgi:membrane protease YdiL (CAAX protease family)